MRRLYFSLLTEAIHQEKSQTSGDLRLREFCIKNSIPQSLVISHPINGFLVLAVVHWRLQRMYVTRCGKMMKLLFGRSLIYFSGQIKN